MANVEYRKKRILGMAGFKGLTQAQSNAIKQLVEDKLKPAYKVKDKSYTLQSDLMKTVAAETELAVKNKVKVEAEWIIYKLQQIVVETSQKWDVGYDPKSALRALELLGKSIGMFSDRLEVEQKVTVTAINSQIKANLLRASDSAATQVIDAQVLEDDAAAQEEPADEIEEKEWNGETDEKQRYSSMPDSKVTTTAREYEGAYENDDDYKRDKADEGPKTDDETSVSDAHETDESDTPASDTLDSKDVPDGYYAVKPRERERDDKGRYV